MASPLLGILSYNPPIAQRQAVAENKAAAPSNSHRIQLRNVPRRVRRLVFFYQQCRRHRLSHHTSLLMAWQLSKLHTPRTGTARA